MIDLDQFESLVLSQQPATQPWVPVTDYSLERRRLIEGHHPALILETFSPTRVLDVGSGFNYLVQFLNERAGHTIAYGADVNPTFADLELDITLPDPPRIGGDLVICREVIEHLTVLQIRRAVTNLCALSSRYVYVTTRFSSGHLLEIETSDALDPTHISLVNQDFLRVLFVLEGFKRRADLETRMDWMQKGRVLVYERAA